MRVLVVSNMYPSKKFPFYGTFVKSFCDQVHQCNIDFDLSVVTKSNVNIEKYFKYSVFVLLTIYKILFGKYDVIYVHYPLISYIPVFLVNLFKKQNIFVNLHGSDLIPESKKQKLLLFFTIKSLYCAKRVIVPSEYYKCKVINKYNIDKSKIYIYPSGGINLSVFSKASEDLVLKFKNKYGLNNKKRTIGFAGRISYKKGWDTFIDSILMIDNYLQYNFIVVGEGSESYLLRKKILEKDLSSVVKVLPLLSQEDLSVFYSSIDLFIFPSKREGESLGLVALEAMACCVPVVSSNYGAQQYYVKDGYNGLKFEVDNPSSLANSINSILSYSDEDLNNISNNCLYTAKLYSSGNCLNQLKLIFSSK